MSELSLELVETLGEIATAAVILGLIVEYVPPFFSHFRVPWYERPRLSRMLLHVIGPVLVVGGVVSELAFHHISTGIQDGRDIEQKSTIIEMQKIIAPRFIGEAQRSLLVDTLREFPGQKIILVSYALDIEAANFGEQFTRAFIEAETPFDDLRMSTAPFRSITAGMRVTGTNDDFLAALTNLLKAFGFQASNDEPNIDNALMFGNPTAPVSARIFIGVKPLAR